MEGFFQVRSVRSRTENLNLRGRHELQRRQILLQILELLVVFRGAIFDSHEGPVNTKPRVIDPPPTQIRSAKIGRPQASERS